MTAKIIIINGERVPFEKPTEVIACALLILHVRFTPLGLLKRNCYRILDHLEEWLEEERRRLNGKERAKYSHLIIRVRRLQEIFGTANTRRVFIQRYYNCILSLMGHGHLHGFGFSNLFGDRIRGDAERQSYRNYTLIGKEGREERRI